MGNGRRMFPISVFSDSDMTIQPANLSHAEDITRLIMQAMSDECCQNLAGPAHTLDDFARVMLSLVRADHTQYSYRNALVALTPDDRVAGACVGYRGGDLHALREAFISAAREHFQIDYTGMADETQPGEYYIDSLAVYPEYRRQGIATSLLRAAADHAHSIGLPAALLVDKGNPNARRLYESVGFIASGDATWGGHPMTRMRKPMTDTSEK